MNDLIRGALLVSALMALVSCSGPGDVSGGSQPTGDNTSSDKERVMSPDVPVSDGAKSEVYEN